MREDIEHISLKSLVDIEIGDLVHVKNRARLWLSIDIRSDKLYNPKDNNCGVILGIYIVGYKVRLILYMNDNEIIILSTRISSLSKNYAMLERINTKTIEQHNS